MDETITEDDGPEVSADDLIESVKAGEYDGHLVDLIEAIRDRFQFGTTEQKWKITFEDEEITQDSLTLAEAASVEKMSGQSWAYLNPVNSARECLAIVTATLVHRHHMREVDAKAKVGKWTVEDAVAAVGSYEVERAPKDSAA